MILPKHKLLTYCVTHPVPHISLGLVSCYALMAE